MNRSKIGLVLAAFVVAQWNAPSLHAQDAETLAKAKVEGAVVFYTSAGLTEMKPLVDGFSRKFPFIKSISIGRYRRNF
jgi:hypothetical protein